MYLKSEDCKRIYKYKKLNYFHWFFIFTFFLNVYPKTPNELL